MARKWPKWPNKNLMARQSPKWPENGQKIPPWPNENLMARPKSQMARFPKSGHGHGQLAALTRI